MTVTRMALVLAVAGLATKLWMDYARRKEAPAEADIDLSSPEPASAAGGTVVRAVGSGADSPNDAERLHARGFAETLPGVAGVGMFGSNSQQGPEPGTPGLPDFARGA